MNSINAHVSYISITFIYLLIYNLISGNRMKVKRKNAFIVIFEGQKIPCSHFFPAVMQLVTFNDPDLKIAK
jgi:hypothetical protein